LSNSVNFHTVGRRQPKILGKAMIPLGCEA